MVVALIIGFKYERRSKELPGIVIDLYHAYESAQKMNSKHAKLHLKLITDITKDEMAYHLTSAVKRGVVPPRVVSFISDREEEGVITQYTCCADLKGLLRDEAYNEERVFVYYTGHGEGGDLVLPRGERMSINNFRSTLLSRIHKDAELLVVMDCCNATGMNLPYRLKENVHRLVDLSTNPIFITQKVICISSTESNEESIATREGSIFTQVFFNKIADNNLDIFNLWTDLNDKCKEARNRCGAVDEKHMSQGQTPTIYTSYPNIYSLWDWVTGNNLVPIRFSKELNCIIWGNDETPREKDIETLFCTVRN